MDRWHGRRRPEQWNAPRTLEGCRYIMARRLSLALAAALATVSLSACSLDAGIPDVGDLPVMEVDAAAAPKDAPRQTDCGSLLFAPSGSGPAQWAGWVVLVDDIGTPATMGPKARQGYEDVLSAVGALSLSDTEVVVRDALEAVGSTPAVKALQSYNATHCKVFFAEADRAGDPVADVFTR